nr:MAG TPA: hypothetical protein [Caudoviricetes sp.]
MSIACDESYTDVGLLNTMYFFILRQLYLPSRF